MEPPAQPALQQEREAPTNEQKRDVDTEHRERAELPRDVRGSPRRSKDARLEHLGQCALGASAELKLGLSLRRPAKLPTTIPITVTR